MTDTGLIDLNQFATGADQIKPSDDGFAQPDAGTYQYEIVGLRTTKSKDQTKTFIVLDFQLDNGMKYGQLFQMPVTYGEETQKERDSIARYLRMLVDIGIPKEQVNKPISGDMIAGWTGVLDVTKSAARDGSGRIYTNIRNIRPSQQRAEVPQTAQNTVQPPANSVMQQPTASSGNPFEN